MKVFLFLFFLSFGMGSVHGAGDNPLPESNSFYQEEVRQEQGFFSSISRSISTTWSWSKDHISPWVALTPQNLQRWGKIGSVLQWGSLLSLPLINQETWPLFLKVVTGIFVCKYGLLSASVIEEKVQTEGWSSLISLDTGKRMVKELTPYVMGDAIFVVICSQQHRLFQEIQIQEIQKGDRNKTIQEIQNLREELGQEKQKCEETEKQLEIKKLLEEELRQAKEDEYQKREELSGELSVAKERAESAIKKEEKSKEKLGGKNKELQQKNSELQESLTQLKEKLEEENNTQNQLTKKIEGLEKKISELNGENERLERRVKEEEEINRSLESKKNDLEKTNASLKIKNENLQKPFVGCEGGNEVQDVKVNALTDKLKRLEGIVRDRSHLLKLYNQLKENYGKLEEENKRLKRR